MALPDVSWFLGAVACDEDPRGPSEVDELDSGVSFLFLFSSSIDVAFCPKPIAPNALCLFATVLEDENVDVPNVLFSGFSDSVLLESIVNEAKGDWSRVGLLEVIPKPEDPNGVVVGLSGVGLEDERVEDAKGPFDLS